MKYTLLLTLIIILVSCETKVPPVVNEIREINRDHFINGKKEIDSLKELSIKEGLSGNFSRLKELCELVAKLDSSDADNLSRLSLVYFIDKNYNQGLTTINRSIKADTGNYLKHNFAYKACLFNALEVKDSSEYYFKKMLTTSNHGLDLNSLTQVLTIVRDTSRFYEYNDLTLKYYPFNEDANLAEAMRVYQTKPYEAIKILNRLESKVKSASLYAERSFFYHNLEKYDLALIDANKAVQLSHETAWILTGRGRTKHKLHDYLGAEDDYKIAKAKGDTTAKRFYKLLLADMNKK